MKRGRISMLTVETVTALTLLGVSPAFSQTAGDNGQEPLVYNGPTLDQSLLAMNKSLQNHYAQDDLMASLYDQPAGDFVEVANAVSTAPEMPILEAQSNFGVAINDGTTLDNSLRVFNADVLMRGEDLFIQVARQESDKALDFTQVASVVGARNEAARMLAEASGASDFGNLVNDGPTLEQNLASLEDMMQALVTREEHLASAVPAVTGSSFDTYALALAMLE